MANIFDGVTFPDDAALTAADAADAAGTTPAAGNIITITSTPTSLVGTTLSAGTPTSLDVPPDASTGYTGTGGATDPLYQAGSTAGAAVGTAATAAAAAVQNAFGFWDIAKRMGIVLLGTLLIIMTLFFMFGEAAVTEIERNLVTGSPAPGRRSAPLKGVGEVASIL